MRQPRRHRSARRTVAAITIVLLVALPLGAWGVVRSGDPLASSGEGTRGAQPRVLDAGAPRLEGTEEGALLAADLRAFAIIWRDYGGRWGYPYWEGAWRSWRAGGLDASTLREYVTGYRELLEPGCEQLAVAEPAAREAEQVRSLLEESCEARVRALEAQSRLLDAVIEEGRRPAVDEEAAELLDEAQDELQASWRDARLAMELAQAQLEALGQERLDENAIV